MKSSPSRRLSAQDNASSRGRFLDEVVNGGNLKALDQLWVEDLAWQSGSLDDFHGLAALTAHMAANASVAR